jgi:hypothetical protein
VRRRLARRLAARPDVTRLRTGAYLAPNRARNVAAAHVRTPYVVFVDNDVLVAPGWLEALVDCADATSAWAVGPLCQQGPWRADEVHLAGGEARIEGEAGARRLVERQAHLGARVADVRASLVRRATDSWSSTRSRPPRRAGGWRLDETALVGEHTDFCLRVREAGGGIWFGGGGHPARPTDGGRSRFTSCVGARVEPAVAGAFAAVGLRSPTANRAHGVLRGRPSPAVAEAVVVRSPAREGGASDVASCARRGALAVAPRARSRARDGGAGAGVAPFAGFRPRAGYARPGPDGGRRAGCVVGSAGGRRGSAAGGFAFDAGGRRVIARRGGGGGRRWGGQGRGWRRGRRGLVCGGGCYPHPGIGAPR